MYDVTIIGAGVTGCAIARELSRYELKILVIDKAGDICEGTSKANSGIAHAGFDALPGTMKAKMNIRGSRMLEQMAEDLDIPYRKNGAMVVSFEGKERLEELYERGVSNGVKNLRIITGDEARSLEPNLSNSVTFALVADDSAIICPFELNLAMAENAAENGAEFLLDTEIKTIEKTGNGYLLNGSIETATLINAAGVFADVIHNMVCEDKIRITARRGEYHLLDKEAGGLVSRTIFQTPTKMGKGILVTPTVHGNLIAGPTASDSDDKDDVSTTQGAMNDIKEKAKLSVPNIPFNKVITGFTGLRATPDGGDFIIQYSAEGFIDAAGIESPGLTSAPAIGEYVKNLYVSKNSPKEKENFISKRKGITRFADLNIDEQNELIRKDGNYGKIVCRCENVTEGEIREAISRPLGARTLDGIKRRTRAGMGRCQAGFCTPRTMEILSEMTGIPPEEIRKR